MVRELTVNFTYTVDTTATSGGGRGGGRGGGMTRNPYIAVWIEDSSGDLVKTVLLWHLQGERDRWLSELRRWSAASGDEETMSSATRSAGSYDVVWDLTDSSGNPVADGSYTLCIESSREHGPYSLVTAELPHHRQAGRRRLEPQGELTGGSLSYRP